MRVELNHAGVGEFLKSDDVKDYCESCAEAIARRCGDGFETDTYVGRNRVNASVYATTIEAIQENSKDNTILKAIR